MTIAYTALWGLLESDPAGEPPEFRATRIELRRRLDLIDDQDLGALHPAPQTRRLEVVR